MHGATPIELYSWHFGLDVCALAKKRLQHLRQLSEQLSFTQINNAITHLSSSIWLVHPQPSYPPAYQNKMFLTNCFSTSASNTNTQGLANTF